LATSADGKIDLIATKLCRRPIASAFLACTEPYRRARRSGSGIMWIRGGTGPVRHAASMAGKRIARREGKYPAAWGRERSTYNAIISPGVDGTWPRGTNICPERGRAESSGFYTRPEGCLLKTTTTAADGYKKRTLNRCVQHSRTRARRSYARALDGVLKEMWADGSSTRSKE